MTISIILISGFLILFSYSAFQYRRFRLLSIIMMLISTAGALMSVFPDATTIMANWVGVGRGADLILYCFVLVMLLVIFNLHLRLRSTQETVTAVARAVALMKTQVPEGNAAAGAEAADSARPGTDEGAEQNPRSP